MIEDLKRRYAKLQGLLNTPMNQSGGILGNIPQGALLGSSIFSQGMQGKDPFSALLPAVAQTAELQKYMTPKKGFKILSKKEAEKIPNYNPKKTYQQNMETKQISVIGGGDTTFNMSNPAETPLKIRKQYLAESDPFKTRKISRDQVLSNTTKKFEDRTAPDDFSLIYQVYKYFDPTSVVREAEFENLQNLGSIGEKLKTIIPKWTKGTTLSKQKVKDLESAMNDSFPSFIKEQNQRENTYKKIFEDGGFSMSYFQSFIPEDMIVNNSNTNLRGMNRKTNASKMTNQELIEEYKRLEGIE